MSKRSSRAVADDYESDGGFVEDAPRSKKQKKELNSGLQKDDEGNEYWELSGKRRVQISEFKGMTMVGVREFYEKDGKTLPGKKACLTDLRSFGQIANEAKGIALTMDQFRTFVGLLPEIERVLEAKGVSVPRPEYGTSSKSTGDGEEEERSMKHDAKPSKLNHEATSDEDEE